MIQSPANDNNSDIITHMIGLLYSIKQEKIKVCAI